MDRLLVLACFVMGLAIVLTSFPDGAVAVILAGALSVGVVWMIKWKEPENQDFLIRVFLLALLARLSLGLIITIFDLHDFFGGDAVTYDGFGYSLMLTWFGYSPEIDSWILETRLASVGWGMFYLVAAIYALVGRNLLAAHLFCAVIGAATAPLVFACATTIFRNRRVGQISSFLVAIYPAFVVWTGQLLKDGLIIFLLVLAITFVLRLQEKFSYLRLFFLLISLGGILALRSYIFYMVSIAVVGMFLVGLAKSQKSMIASFFALMVLGTGFTYLGGLESTSRDIERFTSLEKIQQSRLDLSTRAESGFNEDIDVSTTRGAIQAIPIGFVYLLFAPFPWQMTNLRQLLTLPDMLLWWMSIPFIISGVGYALRFKLKETLGILIFTLMLSLAYAIFQGNVGTAYRQRTQFQVFLFIFAAVGITIFIEKRENRRMILQARRRDAERMREERELAGWTV